MGSLYTVRGRRSLGCDDHYLLDMCRHVMHVTSTTCMSCAVMALLVAEKDDSPSSDSDSEDDSPEGYLKKELLDIPLGELQQARQRMGTKKFDAVLLKARKEREARSYKRANKNRPREMSSKKPVPIFREVISVQKEERQAWDPRFDERSGKLNEDLFKKSYGFVDEMKKKEKHLVEKEVRKTRNPERKVQLQRLMQQMESREKAVAMDEERKALLREHKKTERELVKKGKKPFYIKKATQRKLELAQKYAKLRKSGKLEKFLTKKRRKNASRDRRHLPQHQ